MINIQEINYQILKKWLAEGDAVLIDVREDFEYQEAHIPGAINIPLSNLLSEIAKIDLAGKKIVLQCKIGRRSMLACQSLAEENPNQVLYNLKGGILEWQANGEEVV